MTNYLLMLWEEKNLIKQKMNYLNNKEIVQKDIIKDTNKDSTKNQCRNIGKISGIYKIVNKIDGKYYVGSSKHIYKRWRKHKSLLRHNKHINDYLQNAFNAYGESNFEFIIVEECLIENLKKLEQKYLDIAKSTQNDNYNLNFDVSGGDHSVHSLEKIRLGRINFFKNPENRKIASEISKKQWNNPEFKKTRLGKNHPLYNDTIYQFYNTETKIIESCTMNELYKKYDLHRSNVLALCKNKLKSYKKWIIIRNPE